eukprot:352697-Chlamydomonas_euryale.AAC.3
MRRLDGAMTILALPHMHVWTGVDGTARERAAATGSWGSTCLRAGRVWPSAECCWMGLEGREGREEKEWEGVGRKRGKGGGVGAGLAWEGAWKRSQPQSFFAPAWRGITVMYASQAQPYNCATHLRA